MTGYFRLYYAQCMDKFADAQFAFLLHQQQATQARVIG